MNLLPIRRQSKKQRALKAAGKATKTAAKVRFVRRAPKAAAAVWAARRSGTVVRAVALAIVGVVTLRALRKRRKAPEEAGKPPLESYRTTPTPASSQQSEGGAPSAGPSPPPTPAPGPEAAKEETVAGGPPNESAPGSSIPSPPESESATPPHGDPLRPDQGAASGRSATS